jgi:hypothetical protein
MENKTAVDWILSKIKGDKFFNEFWKAEIKQAKQMEKEQHSETWKRGSYSLLEHGSGEDFERYYKETYGSI